jgi:hypothetical protein
VAALTGSKNALKGVGFFMGGALLSAMGFRSAIGVMAVGLAVIAVAALFTIDRTMGKTSFKPKFSDLFSKSAAINRLSAARLFLFGARDVWFVVALPVFLQLELGWSNVAVGTLLAVWIMGYGAVQGFSPAITGIRSGNTPDGRTAVAWGLALTGIPALIVIAMALNLDTETVVVGGLILFGAVFAVNSAVHSYLIVSYAEHDGVSLDVGFYYMSNAAGRLLGTVCSGWIYQQYGFEACLAVSALFVGIASAISLALPSGDLPLSRAADRS